MTKPISHIRVPSARGPLQLLLALVLILSGAFCAGAQEQKAGSADTALSVTFNDGWRWVYRGRVVDMLKSDVYSTGSLREGVVRAELKLGAKGSESAARDAESLFASLTHDGQNAKAAVLEALISFLDGSDTGSLAPALRLHPNTGYEALGWYLLGDYYDKKGFYPEAEGYYNRLYKGFPDTAARTAGLFQLSRIRYFKGEYEAAKVMFKEAAKAGSAEAPLWLANTLLIKGEFSSAKTIYDTARISPAVADPLTLLSMGDMAIVNGDFNGARSIFERLRARYAKDQFLAAFFDLKRGDAYAAEGRVSDALDIYRKTKENLNLLEGWAMASLSIADVYAAGASREDLLKAHDLYSAVATGRYIGSGQAHLSMAKTALKAGLFAKALGDAKAFPAGHSSSRLKEEMDDLVGDLVVRWMESLDSKHDYYAVVKLHIEHGSSVPFGTKAKTYLLAGKAYAALGLDSDAVNVLDNAVKIARHEVAEEAMVTLANVYISQRDWNSAERLAAAFSSRFPASRYKADADRVLLKAAYIKKDYNKIALSSVRPTDGEGLMMQAVACEKLGRLKDAIGIYSMAIKVLSANGAKEAVAEAYTGIGNANFSLGKYPDAIRAYRKAIDNAGPEAKKERAWALYRVAQSFERLDDDGEKKAALDELSGIKGELSGWADMIFKQEARM